MTRFWTGMASLALGWTTCAQAAPSGVAPDAAFVVLGEDGQAVARAITSATTCPDIVIDGKATPMTLRMAAATLPLRPTASTPVNSKPSAFPVTSCDAPIPPSARHASIAGHALPLPRSIITRIVVIGDTGCRLKASSGAYQACNDPTIFPFAQLAAQAAAWHPHLVLHVGDYHYRETACPDGNAGCAGSPWGYGWDAWNADLFEPGAPLFATAPWAVVRGNHESCARAGQGWWRLLDPRPVAPHRDCNDPADDAVGDAGSAYAVPLGREARIIITDLAAVSDGPTKPDDPRYADTAAVWGDIRRLADGGGESLVATHKPIIGFGASDKGGAIAMRTATDGITSVFAARDPDLLPRGVMAVLSGHIHVWEQVSYSARFPSQFITGFSGTQEDVVPIPARLPADVNTLGLAPDRFSSWVDGFGYMTLERQRANRWIAKVWNLRGQLVDTCRIIGRRSVCAVAQVKHEN